MVPSVSDLIGKWPSVSAWARDIGLKRESHGTLMKMRGRIPVVYWPAMIAAAGRREIVGVTNDALAGAHSVGRPMERPIGKTARQASLARVG